MADEFDHALDALSARTFALPADFPARIWQRVGRSGERRSQRSRIALLSITGAVALVSGLTTVRLSHDTAATSAEAPWGVDQSPSALLALSE
jgi:hypothetical protein